MIYCKLYTDSVSAQDGTRVLIGTTPYDPVAIALQREQLVPSAQVMQQAAQFPDQPDKWHQTYLQQLSTQPEHWLILLDYARKGNLTLLCHSASQLGCLEILAGFLEDELENWQDASSPVCYADLKHLN